MNNGVLKRVILILGIVLFIFSLSACETMKAAISFKWGKRTDYVRSLEAKRPKRNLPQLYRHSTMDNEQKIDVSITPS
jgi:hypothetical protein